MNESNKINSFARRYTINRAARTSHMNIAEGSKDTLVRVYRIVRVILVALLIAEIYTAYSQGLSSFYYIFTVGLMAFWIHAFTKDKKKAMKESLKVENQYGNQYAILRRIEEERMIEQMNKYEGNQ